MKYSISNIAWPQESMEEDLNILVKSEISGIEVAPSKVWSNTEKISFSQIEKYRRLLKQYGFEAVGLHSLLYDHPDLGLFRGKEIQTLTGKFLKSLVRVCADLGGKTLIFGSPKSRNRGKLPLAEAMPIAVDFFRDIAERAKEEKVFFCIEALGLEETDFITSARSALELIKSVDNPGFQGHLDAKALHSSDEVSLEVFKGFSPFLKHFHANEPGLKQLGSTGLINHELLGKYLREINYEGYVSIEQKMGDPCELSRTIKESIEVTKLCYKN